MNNRVPILGQQQQQAKLQLMQAMSTLSLEIYTKMSSEYCGALGHTHLDVEKLKLMAKNSRVAAQAYFEGLGIIEPQ